MEVNAARSEFLIPAAVWSCIHLVAPHRPQTRTESTSPRIYPSLAYCRASDSDHEKGSASSIASFGTNIPNQSSLWKFSYMGILSQIWDTMSHVRFCKIPANNRAIRASVCTALKGIREGQHAQYMALFRGRIHLALNTLLLNSKISALESPSKN